MVEVIAGTHTYIYRCIQYTCVCLSVCVCLCKSGVVHSHCSCGKNQSLVCCVAIKKWGVMYTGNIDFFVC